MMISEFIERTGYEPSYEEYRIIEESYYEFEGNKDEFCRWWKKAQRSGEWAKELRLRKTIQSMAEAHAEELKERDENLEFYRPYFNRARTAEAILLAIGKQTVSQFNISCRGERSWRHFENVSVRYIDNGAIRFINVIEASGWTTSFRLTDIDYIEAR